MFGADWELRHMSISELKHVSEPARRIELFTGQGRRRTWSGEDKAAIVAESYEAFESVCAVARRHGLTPQQLFAWRREARKKTEGSEPTFVPALIVAEPLRDEATAPKLPRQRRASRRRGAAIELEVAGVTVRVGVNATPAAIEAVIRALKATT